MARVSDLSTDYVNGDIFYADGTHEASKSGTVIENTETNKNTEIVEETLNGIVSGCEVRDNAGGADMSVDVQAGVIIVDGEKVTVTAQDVSIDASDGANNRIDLIMVGLNGTADYVKGTAGATPVSPAWTADHVLLATVNVRAAVVVINDADIWQTREIYTGNKLRRFEVLIDATNQPQGTDALGDLMTIFGFPANTFLNWFKIGSYATSTSSGAQGCDCTLYLSDEARANSINIDIVAQAAGGGTDTKALLFDCQWYEDQSDGSDDFLSVLYNAWDGGVATYQQTSSTNFDLSNQIFHVEVQRQTVGATGATATLYKFWIEGY